MQRLDQKQSQDVQQQSQKLDLIKKELQKYRELKKSPSFNNHISSKQFQNCSELEKRKQIFTYINSNQLGQENLSISQINPPQSTRNNKESQHNLLNNKKQSSNQCSQKSLDKKESYCPSQKRSGSQDISNKGNNNASSEHLSQHDMNKNKNNIQLRNNQMINQNREYFREITLADVQNFDMENQQVYFNEEQQYLGNEDFNRNNNLAEMQQYEQDNMRLMNQFDPNFFRQQQLANNLDIHQDRDQEFENNGAYLDDVEQLTFEDLRVKHQGTYTFKDSNDKTINEDNDKKNKKNLVLNNLEENYQHQSSWASTLISSGRNDYEKHNLLNLQAQSNQNSKGQQQSFLTSQNTLTSQMSQKLKSIGSGRLNQSSQSSDQQIPFLKECLSTTSNSRNQLTSNHTISSKNKTLSKDSQGFQESTHPRLLSIHPEFKEDISQIKQSLRVPYEEKEQYNSSQNTNVSKSKLSIENNITNKTSPRISSSRVNSTQNSNSKRQSLHNTLASPPISPKNSIPQKQSKSFYQSEVKRLAVSASVSPNSKTLNAKSINKENKSKDNSLTQDKKDDSHVQSKCQKLNAILQEKASTTKNTTSTNSSHQPYFKSLRLRNEKTPPKNKIDQSNISSSKIIQQSGNTSMVSQDKAKQFSNIGKSAPSKPVSVQISNIQNNQNQHQQIASLQQDDIQYENKQILIERRLTEESERWKEIGSQMVLAYEELNQNFKLLVKQKKQQDIMLQQLVESLAQKEAFERSTQNLSPVKNSDEDNTETSLKSDGEINKQKQCKQSESPKDLQMLEIVSEIQGKLFKKFDKHDSIQIQTLLNQFSKMDKQNKDLKSKQKDIERIVNVQVKESSSLADQIIHLRTQLDKACITMIKNQKESSHQFSQMITMFQNNKNNSLVMQPNAQSIILHEESFNPNIAQSIIKQIDQNQNFSLGSMFSPINSKTNLHKGVTNDINKPLQQHNNSSRNIYDETRDYKETTPNNLFLNQNYVQNINQTKSYLQFNNYGDTYNKQQNQNDNYIPILNQISAYNHKKQNDSFEIVSPIRKDSVPFFGEVNNNSIETNEEIQFQAEYN